MIHQNRAISGIPRWRRFIKNNDIVIVVVVVRIALIVTWRRRLVAVGGRSGLSEVAVFFADGDGGSDILDDGGGTRSDGVTQSATLETELVLFRGRGYFLILWTVGRFVTDCPASMTNDLAVIFTFFSHMPQTATVSAHDRRTRVILVTNFLAVEAHNATRFRSGTGFG